MSVLHELYLKNDPALDLVIYKKLIPYFENCAKFNATTDDYPTDFINLPPTVKEIFRDLIYERYTLKDYHRDIECTNEEFLILYEFLEMILFNKPSFKPVFNRYLFKYRHNREFMIKTAHIHLRPEYLNETNRHLDKTGDELYIKTRLYKIILDLNNLSETINKMELYNKLTLLVEENNPHAIHLYALYFLAGVLVRANDSYASYLFKMNWEKNKFLPSLAEYVELLYNGWPGNKKDIKKAIELSKLGWESYYCEKCLMLYAFYLYNQGSRKNMKDAIDLYRLNWEANNNAYALNNYAYYIQNKEINETFIIYKLNYELNNHIDGIYNLAYMYIYGEGCKKNLKLAQKLFWLDWEKYGNRASLISYINSIQEYGIKHGGTENNIYIEQLDSYEIEEEDEEKLNNYYENEECAKLLRKLYQIDFAINNNKEFIKDLAWCNMKGIGGPQDLEYAIYLYNQYMLMAPNDREYSSKMIFTILEHKSAGKVEELKNYINEN